ncbi:MAG: O-antigen ligase family protein, partial [Pseudobdellovibrionaceae bacterium]
MAKLKMTLHRWAVLFVSLIFIIPHVWSIYLNQNFVYPKAMLLDFILALVPLILAFESRIRVPPKNILILAGLMFITRLIPTVMNWNWVTAYSFVSALCFGMMVLYYISAWIRHQLSLKMFFWPYLLTSYAIFIFVLNQYIKSRILAGNPEPLFFSGPFGNINMMSEYIIFLLPMGFILLRSVEGCKAWLLQIGLLGWITILLVGQSRSAWMGLLICFAYGLWRGLSKREWATYAVGLALFFTAQTIPTAPGQDYAQAKKGSLMKRMTLYQGATRMLADQPLGIGGGEFEYGYLPYQISTEEAPVEREKFNTPHNEFLKWGIENGWAFLLVICIWWFALGRLVWKIHAPREMQTFYRMSFLVLGPQMFFQFPFENPASFLVLTFLIALMLAAGKTQEWPMKNWMKALAIVISIGLFAKASTQGAARWIESQHAQDRDLMSDACPMDPTNWRLCFLHTMSLIDYYPEDARRSV